MSTSPFDSDTPCTKFNIATENVIYSLPAPSPALVASSLPAPPPHQDFTPESGSGYLEIGSADPVCRNTEDRASATVGELRAEVYRLAVAMQGWKRHDCRLLVLKDS